MHGRRSSDVGKLPTSTWNRFGQSELNDGQRAFEECCHAPSHISGRKPLRTPRPDRWTRAPLVNRSGRRNSFGHLVDGLRLRRRGPISPLTGGTRAAREGRAGRDEKISQAGVRVGGRAMKVLSATLALLVSSAAAAQECQTCSMADACMKTYLKAASEAQKATKEAIRH